MVLMIVVILLHPIVLVRSNNSINVDANANIIDVHTSETANKG